ncbi:MAG: acyltransferase [Burkholderiaceae bacterium]|nr:acyltransferase [Burkholderiaceae bacterium]
MYIFIRKIRSTFSALKNFISTASCYFLAIGNPALTIGGNCHFKKSVKLVTTDGGSISIGKGSCLSESVQIVAQGGHVIIGDNVFIGIGCLIVSKNRIIMGNDTLIAEYVVIRDQDHKVDSRPIRISGFHTSPIHIGEDVWIGCKASVLRGAHIGDRCVIGAHALVKSHIADGLLAVGVPARPVKYARNK